MIDAICYGAMTAFALIALGAIVTLYVGWRFGEDIEAGDVWIVGLLTAVCSGLAVFFGVLAA